MSRARLLLVNIGNTHTTLALYRAGRTGRRTQLPTDSKPSARLAALAALLKGQAIAGAALCSVVPSAEPEWMKRLSEIAGMPVVRIGPDSPLGVRIDVPRPAEVGPDRLANVAAAAACYGTPTIVVDAGTATAISLVVRGRGIVGGAIAPGPALFYEYLAERTARLPRLKPGGSIPPFGRTTVAAMRLGAGVGYAGMVRALLDHVRRVPELRKALIVTTGGGGRALARALGGVAIHDGNLTLIGIGIVADRVHSGERS